MSSTARGSSSRDSELERARGEITRLTVERVSLDAQGWVSRPFRSELAVGILGITSVASRVRVSHGVRISHEVGYPRGTHMTARGGTWRNWNYL